MPNALIQPYIQGTQAAVTATLFDPRFEKAARRRFHRPLIPQLELANSLYVSSGLYPARAWILLYRADYNKLNLYATNLQLQLDDLQGPPLTFANLAIVQSRCVSRGLATDPSAVYLVELTDPRGLIYNQWFQWPVDAFYNVRASAYPDDYYTDSLQGGSVPWDWPGMLQDLWESLTPLGAFPGLPVSPTATLEGFTYTGVSAWEAICQILNLLGCAVAVDLTNAATPYSIVDLSQDDAAFTALQAQYVGRLEDDLEWIDAGAARAPGSVTVLFQRRNTYYGTEETIRKDGLQWMTTPNYAVTVAAPAPWTGNPGQHYIWCEFTVRFDVDGNPLAADVTTANAVAQERTDQYFADLRAGTSGFMRQTYAGVLPFTTGSRCDGVYWHMDFRAEDYKRNNDPVFRMMASQDRPETKQSGRLGWRTEIIRGVCPAWPEVELKAR